MEKTEKKTFWSKIKSFFKGKNSLSTIAKTSLGLLLTVAIAGGGFASPQF